MDFATRQVLVTGAGGWLGRRLVETLAGQVPESLPPPADLAIRCLVLSESDAADLRRLSHRVEVVIGDLRSRADCERLCAGARGAVLFHAAGIIHPRRVREFYEVNVDGTDRLLQAAAEAGVRRAVIVSSNSPCGCNPSRSHRFDEKSP